MPFRQTCRKDFKTRWIPATKSFVASAADIAGDWVYYDRVVRENTFGVERFQTPLFAFAIVSSVFGLLLVISFFVKGPKKNKYLRWIEGLEMMFGDVPQFVLTAMVTAETSTFSPTAVFNITTSSYNFIFNGLSLIEEEEPEEKKDEEEEESDE